MLRLKSSLWALSFLPPMHPMCLRFQSSPFPHPNSYCHVSRECRCRSVDLCTSMEGPGKVAYMRTGSRLDISCRAVTHRSVFDTRMSSSSDWTVPWGHIVHKCEYGTHRSCRRNDRGWSWHSHAWLDNRVPSPPFAVHHPWHVLPMVDGWAWQLGHAHENGSCHRPVPFEHDYKKKEVR